MIPVQHGRPELGLVPWLQMWKSKSGENKYSCRVGSAESGEWWTYHLWPDWKFTNCWGLWKRYCEEKARWYTCLQEMEDQHWWLEGSDGLSRVLIFRGKTPREIYLYHCCRGARDEEGVLEL